jgi:Protein of unknown function (DUF2637)
LKRIAPWAWLVVLGTALALSWWSLDALALHFGVPKVLAAMVSATFDGAALVAADLALRRAVVADPVFSVKLLMLVAVGLSAWLNWQHGALLAYPLVGRVLFAAPSVLSGWLFELQLRHLRRTRLRETGRTAKPLPQFGLVVWAFHPWAALKKVSQIAESRLRSVPVTVMDWEAASAPARELATIPGEVMEERVLLAAPVEADSDDHGQAEVDKAETEGTKEGADTAIHVRHKGTRSGVPDELYLVKLRNLVDEAGGVMPSAREVARRLSVGQDRARRLIGALRQEQPPGPVR